MSPPVPTGERLALVFGHSLPDAAFLDRGERRELSSARTGAPVVVVDTGDVVVMRRHGVDTFTLAHQLDHHRHVEVLAEMGCNRILALGSTGSLRVDWPPGTIVAPDDFLALGIAPSFFDDARAHSTPGFDLPWRRRVVDAWRSATSTPIADGGVYAQTPGPRFESPAEVRFLADYADLVGMTLASELVLAREAGMSYAAVCTIDNLANGLDDQPLSLDDFWANKRTNEQRMAIDLDAVLPALIAPTP
jgi:purine nucleoside phosphorylase